MIEPGFPTLLAHPFLAFALAALALASAVALLVRAERGQPAARREDWWRRLGVLAEVLLALGLIGLTVFAGRITLAASQVQLEQRVQAAQRLVDERRREVISAQCAAPSSTNPGAVPVAANLTPFNPGVAANELCTVARAQPAPGATVLEWQMAAQALREFGARYPGCVDNVFSRNNDCESTVGSATRLAATVDALAAAMTAAQRDGATLLAVHGERDWGSALLAALLAAAALAIRIARAWSSLRERDGVRQ
jgi:type II secretory pathway pseudopilin PulG